MSDNNENDRALWQAEDRLVKSLAEHGITLLRVSLGVIFFWFGALKFHPKQNPIETLAAQTIKRLTFGLVKPRVSVPILAGIEVFIGLGLLTRKFIRGTLLVMLAHMIGTMSSLIVVPGRAFKRFPYMPTVEGHYVIKNIVLISAGLVIGATLQGEDEDVENDQNQAE
jgi:uncharacterized membrane protein YkgB